MSGAPGHRYSQSEPVLKNSTNFQGPLSAYRVPCFSPYRGLGLVLLGGWCGLAHRRFTRASLGVLRPAGTLGVVGHCQMALEADPESSSIAELTAIGFHLIAHRCIQRRILGNLEVKAPSHSEGIGSAVFALC